MPWLARKPRFERTTDFLIELPIPIVRDILRMSLNKTNYRALKYTIGSRRIEKTVQNEVLILIDDIIKEERFVTRELAFDIKVNHLMNTAKYHNYFWKKDSIAISPKRTNIKETMTCTDCGNRDDMIDEVELITQGYDCIQSMCIHEERENTPRDIVITRQKYFSRPKIMILDFWRMYSHARESNIVQQMINAIRLVARNKRSRSHVYTKLSFTVELKCRKTEKKGTKIASDGEVINEFDTFIHLELIALDLKLLQHIDRTYLHVATGTTHPYQRNTLRGVCPRYYCLCRQEGWLHGSSGNISSWSLITILGKGLTTVDGRRLVVHPISAY